MTRRAKLSLATDQQHKGTPPHGFDGPQPAAAGESAEQAGPAPEQAAPARDANRVGRRAGGRWRADRQAAGAAGAGAGPQAGEPRDPAGQTSASAMPAGKVVLSRAAALSRHPVVRVVGLSLLAGLSIYLLRRRLF